MMWIILGILILYGFFVIYSLTQNRKLIETVTKSNRGTDSERDLVLKLLKHDVPAQTIFHDLYVKKYNGDFSQIDLVVATKVGIIVFEVKDYSGWIFGDGRYTQWTKVLAYGKEKYRFYNPIMQNNKHIEDLRKRLKQFENIPFYSIVVFYGNCVLKDINFVPNGTFLVKSGRVLEVMNNIMSNNESAQYTNKIEVVKVLSEAVQNGENKNIQIKHIENIKEMLGKDRIFE